MRDRDRRKLKDTQLGGRWNAGRSKVLGNATGVQMMAIVHSLLIGRVVRYKGLHQMVSPQVGVKSQSGLSHDVSSSRLMQCAG